jgi:hypothetical protein
MILRMFYTNEFGPIDPEDTQELTVTGVEHATVTLAADLFNTASDEMLHEVLKMWFAALSTADAGALPAISYQEAPDRAWNVVLSDV